MGASSVGRLTLTTLLLLFVRGPCSAGLRVSLRMMRFGGRRLVVIFVLRRLTVFLFRGPCEVGVYVLLMLTALSMLTRRVSILSGLMGI